MNTKAADSHGKGTEAEIPPEAEDAQTDAEALQLQGQVQQILQSCAKTMAKDEVMELSEEEESQPQKRPRSMEPFGASAPAL